MGGTKVLCTYGKYIRWPISYILTKSDTRMLRQVEQNFMVVVYAYILELNYFCYQEIKIST